MEAHSKRAILGGSIARRFFSAIFHVEPGPDRGLRGGRKSSRRGGGFAQLHAGRDGLGAGGARSSRSRDIRVIAVSGGDGGSVFATKRSGSSRRRACSSCPRSNGDDGAVRRLMTRYLDRRARPQHFGSEERYRFLSSILESFTATLELKEVLRRIVTITRQEFGADRAWLLHPVNEKAEVANVRFAVSAPEYAIEPDAIASHRCR